MIALSLVKKSIYKILAITEKNLKLDMRAKYNLIIALIFPIIGLIMPIILMDKFFTFNDNFGPWTKDNYLVYQFIALNILLLQRIIISLPNSLMNEKYWQTLPALIIAPFNRVYLLFGNILSFLAVISIPFTVFFVICYLYYPISILTLLFVIGIYILIILVFSGLGLFIGIFIISKENLAGFFSFIVSFFFLFSCISYPYELFPKLIQDIVNLNPLYHMFKILRLVWVEDDIFLTIASHPLEFSILIISAIIFPFLGVTIFNKVYKKYGIVGY